MGSRTPNVGACCASPRDISGRCGKTLNKKGKSKSKRLKAAIVPQNCTLSAAHPPAFNLVSPQMISCSHITHQQSIQSAQRECAWVCVCGHGAVRQGERERKDERRRTGRACMRRRKFQEESATECCNIRYVHKQRARAQCAALCLSRQNFWRWTPCYSGDVAMLIHGNHPKKKKTINR